MNKTGINYKILLLICIFMASLFNIANAQYYNNSYNYGSESVILEDFQFATASQLQSQWCWAACITMVLNYYDIPCTQEEVVMRTYGTLVNYPARDLNQIAQYLNGWGMTREGRKVMVQAETYQFVPFQGIIEELKMGKPFIIGVGNGYSGHVVVCYGVDWTQTYMGPYVTKFYVYDPWPGNGHREWNTQELNTYWVGAIGIDVN